MRDGADVIVVGAGLAGLVATAELADAGRRVLLVDQEPEGSLGGQAFWSFGGLFLVDSPEQRRMRIRDSYELAWQDWLGTAAFDRPVDLRFRHKVDALATTDGAVTGVAGEILEPSAVARGRQSSREAVGAFELRASAVVVTSGGIGANHELVRRNWPERLGPPPRQM